MRSTARTLLLATTLLCTLGQPDAAASKRPNVVWIVIDALRADHTGLTINGTQASPFLDSLANDAISFRSAISQESYTMASVPSYFTSKYPTEHRVLYDQPRIDVLAESHLTIAELMRDSGYATAAFVFNPHLRGKYGFGQGFEVYDDKPGGLAAEESAAAPPDGDRAEASPKTQEAPHAAFEAARVPVPSTTGTCTAPTRRHPPSTRRSFRRDTRRSPTSCTARRGSTRRGSTRPS